MYGKRSVLSVLAVVVLWGVVTSCVSAAPIFFGPTPYLSAGDIPAGFYAGGVPTALENFRTARSTLVSPPRQGGNSPWFCSGH